MTSPRGARWCARLAVVASLASCATPPLAPGVPHVAERMPIAPYGTHEACADLAVGDRLDYRYDSSVPIDFDIRYREANAVVSPVVRPHSTGDSDIFEVRVPARYCLEWQAGADGAIIGYRILIRRD